MNVAARVAVSLSLLTLDGLSHLLLPAFNLALFKISLVIRLRRVPPLCGGLLSDQRRPLTRSW